MRQWNRWMLLWLANNEGCSKAGVAAFSHTPPDTLRKDLCDGKNFQNNPGWCLSLKVRRSWAVKLVSQDQDGRSSAPAVGRAPLALSAGVPRVWTASLAYRDRYVVRESSRVMQMLASSSQTVCRATWPLRGSDLPRPRLPLFLGSCIFPALACCSESLEICCVGSAVFASRI